MSELNRIGKNIKHYRIKRNLSQMQASKAAGISNHFWGWVEKGKKRPSLKTLEKICQVVDASMSEIFKKNN